MKMPLEPTFHVSARRRTLVSMEGCMRLSYPIYLPVSKWDLQGEIGCFGIRDLGVF